MKSFFFLIGLILVFYSASHAQKSINIFQLSAAPVIDGEFDEQLWQNTAPASGFVQMEPQPGSPASAKTEVYTGVFNQSIYILIKCYQLTPVVARNQSRDALTKDDDLIAVMLDTYNDNRSGYVFALNPLGTQIDGKINDDGRNTDINWDTEWSSSTRTFDWGWIAEFKIPFNSLKYKRGIEEWGINFGRVIRANSETAYWSGLLSDDFRMSQGGKIRGLNTPGTSIKFSLFPYTSLFKTTNKNWSFDAGGDVHWQISPSISFNGTINPDFATVEADQQQINLSRYELSYPEKRLFFQEGNEMYNTRIRTFYSRRIQDIDFGERLNGKIGKTQFNILNVRAPYFSDEEPASWLTAARAKIDFLKSSTLGLTLVDKSWDDGYTRSLSIDYLMNLGKTWKLTGQFVGSAPGNLWDHSAWFVRFARENNIYHYHIRYTEIGENFKENVNQTGFVRDDDRREIDSDITYRWWLKNNTFEYINFYTKNNFFWSRTKGDLRSWYLADGVNLYFKNKFNLEYSYNNEYKNKDDVLFEKEFHNNQHRFEIGYNTDEWSHALISYTTGKNFDRDLNLISGGGRVKLLKKLSVTFTANWLEFSPDLDDQSTFINVLSVNYNFTNNLWVQLFAQNNTENENFYFYTKLGWRFKPPFGALYLIYSHDEYAVGTGIPNTNNFFLKLTYPISLFY